MQFKVISALIFATLAAAGALPRADTNPINANLAKTGSDTGNTNHGTTNNANNANTNHATNIAPPYNGNPPPTIAPSKCSSGHLRCCDTAELPTASDVASHFPSDITADSISGYVGLTCTALAAGAKPTDCPKQPVCCTDNSYGDTISLGCNKVDLSM